MGLKMLGRMKGRNVCKIQIWCEREREMRESYQGRCHQSCHCQSFGRCGTCYRREGPVQRTVNKDETFDLHQKYDCTVVLCL